LIVGPRSGAIGRDQRILCLGTFDEGGFGRSRRSLFDHLGKLIRGFVKRRRNCKVAYNVIMIYVRLGKSQSSGAGPWGCELVLYIRIINNVEQAKANLKEVGVDESIL
jgi:hypothetical protein